MAAPTPEDADLLAKIVGAFVAIVAPLWGCLKYLDTRFEKKADKEVMNASLTDITEELSTQRSNIAKLFDQIRDNEHRAQDRHERLMEKLR